MTETQVSILHYDELWNMTATELAEHVTKRLIAHGPSPYASLVIGILADKLDEDEPDVAERIQDLVDNPPSPAERPAGFVIKAPGQGYLVRSRSTEGAWWFVVGNDCSCPAGRHGHLCWHIRQTFAFEKLMATPRPSVPTNVSAMVD